MASIDYGAVILKNNKVINENKSFIDMKEALGFSIDSIKDKKTGKFYKINNKFSAYAGSPTDFFCIYKLSMIEVRKEGSEFCIVKHFNADSLPEGYIYNNKHLKVFVTRLEANVVEISFTVNGVDQCTIVFGYGIDCNYEVQLCCAYAYGISVHTIQYLTKEIWGRPVLVTKIKRHKQKYYTPGDSIYDKYTFSYKYKEINIDEKK